MKIAVFVGIGFALILLPDILCARKIGGLNPHHGHHSCRHHHHHHHIRTSRENKDSALMKVNTNFFSERRPSGLLQDKPETVELAGSRLPDCSHACGSCSPCRLVMVSFVCASLEEAESCPMAYRCMCRHKTYPVP